MLKSTKTIRRNDYGHNNGVCPVVCLKLQTSIKIYFFLSKFI